MILIYAEPLAHRDLKPGNILLDEKMHVYLTDFGSCRPARIRIKDRIDALRIQEDAEINSTVTYRPPELFHAKKNHRLDERTDVWVRWSPYCIIILMKKIRILFHLIISCFVWINDEDDK